MVGWGGQVVVVGWFVGTCPVTKEFACNTPQDGRRRVAVKRHGKKSRSSANLFPDVTLFL